MALSTTLASLSLHADDFYSPDKYQFNVPEINSGIGLIDQQKEKFIGEKVYRQVQSQLPVLNNLWLEEQFMTVFRKILAQTKLGQPIGLVVVNDSQINAFAVPGGLFALNSGLITSARNLDEVAGVMAHEIAHVSQRHFSRSQEAFKGQGLLALAGIIVGAAIATQTDAGAGSALMLGTQAALLDKQLSYSRNQEREADRIGMQLMYSAGFNPHSMAEFFETMNRATSRISYLPDFWLTHPLTTQRMSEARLRADQLPKVPYSNTLTEFDQIKWYTAVVSNQANEQQLQDVVRANALAGRIALTAYYLKRGDYDLAKNEIKLARSIQPKHQLISLLQTDLYLAKNEVENAFKEIIVLQRVVPENRALGLKLAEIYIRKGDFKSAETLLLKFTQKNYRDVVAWNLLQQAANLDIKNPLRTVNVLRYRAEFEFWKGSEESAIRSLIHAQRLAKNNNLMSAKIDQRLKSMQDDRRKVI